MGTKLTDDDVKNMAGHADAIPEIYRQWYLKGYRAAEPEPIAIPLHREQGGDLPSIAEIYSTPLEDELKASTPAGKEERVICLCGSLRFKKQYGIIELHFVLAGNTVLTPCCMYVDAQRTDSFLEHKPRFDEQHKHKIDISDEIFVIDVDGYIGESTLSEIQYAEKIGKPVYYLSQTPSLLTKTDSSSLPSPQSEQAGENKWKDALLSLTVGGSEYVDDPQRCVTDIRQFQDGQRKYILELKALWQAASQEKGVGWVKASERLPEPGREVKMKWVDGSTEWIGNILIELKDVKPEHYDKLLWFDQPAVWVVSNERRPKKEGFYYCEDSAGNKTMVRFYDRHWNSLTNHPVSKWLDESPAPDTVQGQEELYDPSKYVQPELYKEMIDAIKNLYEPERGEYFLKNYIIKKR